MAPGTGVAPAAAHVFVDRSDAHGSDDHGLGADRLLLRAEDAHHLVRVLRLRDGQPVTAGDGAGAWRLCRLRLAPGADPELEPAGPVVEEPPDRPELAVAVALPKGDRGDWAVQKLTELGVDRILPLVAARSVVRWSGQRAERGQERLGRIARAAAMQSRRARLPVVAPPADPASVVGAHPGAVCAAEAGGGPPALDWPIVLVGPEGGWDPGELPADLPRVGLGPTTLRTETAAVAVAAALVLLRAGLVAPAGGPADPPPAPLGVS